MRHSPDRGSRRPLSLLIAMAAALALGLVPPPIAHAAGFTVTKSDDTADGHCDPSDCSLREAIIAANTNPGPNTIALPAGTYNLILLGGNEDSAATGDLDIAGDLTITGALSSTTIIDAGQRDRVFEVLGANVTIANVTIQNGNALKQAGGGLRNTGTLTLLASTIAGNISHEAGGGIANNGTLTLTDSTISDNSAFKGGSGVGGGIVNAGMLTATNSVFRKNSAQDDGGGIYNASSAQSIVHLSSVTFIQNIAGKDAHGAGNGGGMANNGVATLTNSFLSDNSAYSGGAIVTQLAFTAIGSTISGNTATFGGGMTISGTLTMTNSTISGNSALENGGGIATIGTVDLNNVTIAGNTADSDGNGSGDGGGIRNIGGAVNVKNTLLAGNVDKSGQAPECTGTLTSQDYNLILQPAGCTIEGSTAHTIIGEDPRLGPLQHNGGPTPTRALLDHSPAIDAGDPAPPGPSACASTDQRGIVRPQQARCDIGAVEKIPPPVATLALKPALIAPGGASTLTITLTNASATSPISGLALSDELPTGLSIAATPPASTTCGGALAASAGGNSIALAGGALAAGASCSLTVAVTSAAEGTFMIGAGLISATETGAAGQGGQATLTVQTPLLLFLPLTVKTA